MTTNKPTELVPTQADRSAVANLARNPNSGLPPFIADPVEAGEMDWHPLVQAFAAWNARYRNSDIASTAPASEDEVERVARAIKSVWDVEMREEAVASNGDMGFEPGPWEEWIPEARAAIAALRPRSEREEVGRRVAKRGGDYEFDGEIVGVIRKRSGAIRYAVEDDRGLLLIMNAKQVGIDERGDFKEPGE